MSGMSDEKQIVLLKTVIRLIKLLLPICDMREDGNLIRKELEDLMSMFGEDLNEILSSRE